MDRRTKRQKLIDMANQSVSPNEAEIAKKKLKEMGEDSPQSGIGDIYINGVKVGRGVSVTFTVNYSEPDPGIGVYDFAKDQWVWTPRPSGTKQDIYEK